MPIRCHINAFRYFGGVPHTVKIDNLKAAILEATFYEPVYQQVYKQFAEHYGCMLVPCRVRSPQEKGKVESGIKYVSNNFFAGRKFDSWNILCAELRNWVNNKCNMRIHGTTRKVPREHFEMEEKSHLVLLPITDFIFPEIIRRKVYRDCLCIKSPLSVSFSTLPSYLTNPLLRSVLIATIFRISLNSIPRYY